MHTEPSERKKEKREKKPNRNEQIFVINTHKTNSNEPCLFQCGRITVIRHCGDSLTQFERKRERFLERNVNTALWHPKQTLRTIKYKRCEYDLLFDFASLCATVFRSLCVYDKFYDISTFIASNDGNLMVNTHMAHTELIALQKKIVYHSVSIC